MRRSLFDDDFSSELSSSPNPKPNRTDKEGFGSLASLYTAYSSEFARFSLELCEAKGHRRIADPFAGMGTLAEAGRQIPVALRLNDINPYASLACCTRSAPAQAIYDAAELLERIARPRTNENESAYFSQSIRRIASLQKADVSQVVTYGWKQEFQVSSIALFGLATARIALHRRLKGSNPTWTKKAGKAQFAASRIEAALSNTLVALRRYARSLAPLTLKYTVQAGCADIADVKWRGQAIDAIVTSPPYPNRTDYIRHYLPGAELLISSIGADERSLRERQIGTPLIREHMPTTPLPTSVMSLLEKVRSHDSYASERYYHKGFAYYFADMSAALERFERWLAPNGALILVLQDTYYKELHIPVADLFIDLAHTRGFKLKSRADWRVRQALSRLSPHSRRTGREIGLQETALYFSK